MEHWNFAVCDPRKNDGASMFLLNRSRTPIRVHKRLHYDPATLFRRLELVGFPFRYTNGLEQINFTILPGDNAGYYMDNGIWIDIRQAQLPRVLDIFVHEVGHHVDEQEAVSSFLHKERLLRAKHLHEKFSSRTDDEYLALGFEKFYSETHSVKMMLKKKNPMLYKTIQGLHREYRRK